MDGFPLVRIAMKSYESDTANPYDPVIASDSLNTLREITLSENEIYLRIKKRVVCLYGVIMHEGGILGEYERTL